MTNDDWIGLGTSVGVHGVLLALFALLSTSPPEDTAQLGSLAIEVNAFSEAAPSEPSAAPANEAPSTPAEEMPPSSEPAPAEEAPEPAAEEPETPVDLPEQEDPPAGEDPTPEPPPSEEEPVPSESTPTKQEATSAPEASGAEAEEASASSSNAESGEGEDEATAAPFDIEGLDRTRLYGTLPSYSEQVEATIKVEITVGPQGRVIGQRLVQKANPSLERSVTEALRRWRFNRLPPNAPQENQTGVVTFRFRLE